MIYRKLLAHWRIILPLALLVMILLRLVWIQIRHYQVEVDPASVYALTIEDTLGTQCEQHWQVPLEPDSQSKLGQVCQYLYASGSLQNALLHNALLHSQREKRWHFGDLLSVFLPPPKSLSQLLKVNQWLLVGNAFLAALLARFLSGSWIVALISATVILSRGSLAADVTQISLDRYLVFLTTFWFTLLVHHLKTGSKVSQYGLVGTSLLLAYAEFAFLGLFWIPVAAIALGFIGRKYCLPLIRQRWGRHQAQVSKMPVYVERDIPDDGFRKGVHTAMSTVRFMLGMEESTVRPAGSSTLLLSFVPGSLFRPLKAPPYLWFFRGRRWQRYLLQSLLVAVVASVMMFVLTKGYVLFLDWQQQDYWQELILLWNYRWEHTAGVEYTRRLDLHLVACLIVVGICALPRLYNPEDGFFEAVWLLIVSLLLLGASLFLTDMFDVAQVMSLSADDKVMYYQLLKPLSVLKWLEVVILTFGTIGVYHMVRALD